MAQKIEYRLLMGPKHEVISNNCNWTDKKSKMLETLVLLDIENGLALPLDSLLLRGVAARPCFCLRAWRRKHARHHAPPRDGLKAGLGLTPRSNRLSNGRAMENGKPKEWSV